MNMQQQKSTHEFQINIQFSLTPFVNTNESCLTSQR